MCNIGRGSSSAANFGGKPTDLYGLLTKYLPDVADENRAHTARFPEKVHDKLRRARAIRRKIRARTENPDEGKTQLPKAARGETTTPSRRRPPKKRKLDAARSPFVQEGEGEIKKPEDRPPLPRETKEASATETPPDWGGSETDENQPEPHHNHESSDDGGKARPATNGRGDRREDPQTLEQAAEHSHSDPRSQRGGHPTTFDDKIYQQSALPYRGRLDYQTKGTRRPSTQ